MQRRQIPQTRKVDHSLASLVGGSCGENIALDYVDNHLSACASQADYLATEVVEVHTQNILRSTREADGDQSFSEGRSRGVREFIVANMMVVSAAALGHYADSHAKALLRIMPRCPSCSSTNTAGVNEETSAFRS